MFWVVFSFCLLQMKLVYSQKNLNWNTSFFVHLNMFKTKWPLPTIFIVVKTTKSFLTIVHKICEGALVMKAPEQSGGPWTTGLLVQSLTRRCTRKTKSKWGQNCKTAAKAPLMQQLLPVTKQTTNKLDDLVTSCQWWVFMPPPHWDPHLWPSDPRTSALELLQKQHDERTPPTPNGTGNEYRWVAHGVKA